MTYLEYEERVRGLEQSTIREKEKDLQAFAQSGYMPADMRALTYEMAEAWSAAMRAQGLQPTTINRRLATLSSYCKWLEHTRQTKENGMRGYIRQKEAKTTPHAPSLRTITCYLATASITDDDRQLHALVALMATTGVRISEALALKYTDICKEREELLIHGKGRKERRVSYSGAAKHYLNAWARTRRGAAAVFTWSYADAYKQLTDTLREGGKGITPHQLRHLYATQAAKRGVRLADLAALMGHDDIRTTRRYITTEGD